MKPIPQRVRAIIAERCNGICEAGIIPGCRWNASELHHLKLLSRGGSNDPKNIISVCCNCHRAIHAHKPGTSRFRTHRWQVEGASEESGQVKNA